jgi:hypothetical protein
MQATETDLDTTCNDAAADRCCAEHVQASVCACVQGVLLQAVRGYASKDVRFGIECREAVLAGVNKLADAVQVTLGPKVRQTAQQTRSGQADPHSAHAQQPQHHWRAL